MLDHEIIEPSHSDWASPIVPTTKKDGSLRLCIDYRRLNSISKSDPYPMPRVEDIIDSLGQAIFISTLDLTKGYWQVPVAPDVKHKTAFTTLFGIYQFRCMPFGLKNAPATFQRLMDKLLSDCKDFAASYIDDTAVYSISWSDHLAHLRQVLQRLKDAGLTARPKKCKLGMSECSYLGYVVGRGQVKPEHSKVTAVVNFPQPATKKQVRAFLGLTGYYCKFIPQYASLAAPLSDLTRKRGPEMIEWTPECEEAFKKMKTILCSSPVLQSPNFDAPFVLQTDASDRGIGAVLSQPDKSGKEHPVAYFSKKLLPREEKYSTIEIECLAIKLSVEAFRVYLLG